VARTGVVVLAALAVAEIVAAVFVVRDHHSPTAAVAAPASTPAVTFSSKAPSLGVEATSTSQGSASVLIAFLGDDWTTGTGASRPANRFTTLLARRLGVAERSFGVAGAGYAKASATGGTYAAQVAAVVAAQPDVVVVSGGRNDASDSPDTAAADARRLFATLHAKLPNAVLIGIAPFWGDSDLPPAMIQLGRAVKAAVTAAGGTYLDLPDPIHGHPSFMADAADPNDQGYAAIAAALAPQLQPLLPSD
jgi:lysophospholipase L1-like esterase